METRERGFAKQADSETSAQRGADMQAGQGRTKTWLDGALGRIRTSLALSMTLLMVIWAGNAWGCFQAYFTTRTILTSSPNPSVAGQGAVLTATVQWWTGSTWAPVSPYPGWAATVGFYDGSTGIGSASVVNGVAKINHTFNTAGAHSLHANFSGTLLVLCTSVGANYWANASQSPTITQTVNQAPTTTTLASGTNPSALNQAVTLTATVAGASPTGSVTFMDGTTALGTGTLSSGTANLSYTFTTAGAHSLTAVYGGDSNNVTSTSALVSQSVKQATTTSLGSGTNPSKVGQAVNLTATVTGASPTGTVTFMDGATTLGTGTLNAGIASLSYTFTTAGTHSLTAVYSGDAANVSSTSGVVSQTVNLVATTTALSSGANPSVAGQAVALTATVTGTSPTGTVTFMDGTTTLGTGTLNAGTATLNYTFATAGTHSLTAVYSGDSTNATSTSGAVSQAVGQATTTATLASGINPSAAGQPVTLTATVTGASPTGTVTFMDGATTLGTGTLDGTGTATLSYTFTTAGTHSITASYGGDANNTSSTSPALSQTVNPAATTTALAVSASVVQSGQTVTLTATISGGVNPTGTATFMDGTSTILAGVPITNGIATITATFSTAGTHSLTAVYSGDANNATSTSAAKNVDVTNETITYFHNDVEGTPLAATDAAGNLLWTETYRAYGDPVQTPLDANNNLWYTGKAYDSNTQLSYLGARYYDPLLGRFMGVDPVGFRGNNLQSFNRYAYANNNPIRFVDPDGRDAIDWVHRGLTAASFCPSICGSAFSGIDGLVSLGQGNYGDAGIALGAAVVGIVSDAGAAKAAGMLAKEGARGFDAARMEAFERAGMTDASKVKFSKMDPETGTVVEFKGEGGAKVGYDGPHPDTPGNFHDQQHISWQSAGKRTAGGERGNVPYSGEQHPSRAGRKED